MQLVNRGVEVWLRHVQVIYGAGINEKLLGDFIRKHNVRDKIFCEF